ncbi:MAG: Smr/MutS family protein [Muribaculaceae bacterium]|nr:Smr/MutS family protein [Muribaculaceae bacterium]
MIYPDSFERKIGFDAFREFVKLRCITSAGQDALLSESFSADYNVVCTRINQTDEMLKILSEGIQIPFDSFNDISQSLLAVNIEGAYLTENELFSLLRILNIASDIYQFFTSAHDGNTRWTAISELVANLELFPALASDINSVIDKYGNIKETASPLLRDLHASLRKASSSINSTLRRILNNARENGFIDKDVTPSVRDGRLVIPVPPMFKRKIAGIVHDESATGKTVFIEPAEVVEANNNIREIEAEIRREIIRILIDITARIRPCIDSICNTISILGYLDFVIAKAKAAIDLGGNKPNIHPEPAIEWFHAEHPVLKITLREQGKSIVPLNINLTDGNRILLISGPNAGGKSVTLKTVGINQYMLQCGFLPLVYDNSHFGIFNDIFIDIGDQQSIEDDLSTYSSHLLNMKRFMDGARNSSLILIDEFGGGTEPQIGGALAQAILRNLNSKNVYAVITTHYTNLKHFADNEDGIVNAAMLYDRQLMRPLFQLSIGYPGSSFAIEIARKIGLPDFVVDEAMQIVGSDYVNLDKYVLDIARDRKYWDNKRQQIRIKEKKIDRVLEQYSVELDSLKQQRKEIIKKAKTDASNILAEANSTVERTVHAIKKANAEKEKTKELRRQLDEFKHRLNDNSLNDSELEKFDKKIKRKKPDKKVKSTEVVLPEIVVGDNVTIDGSDSVGTVISIEGQNALVAFGALRTKANLSRLKATIRKASVAKVSSLATEISYRESRERQLNFKQDIDVRGMRSDEALQAVTYFIDDAVRFNISRVRILHGTGNGILRQNIRAYLNTVAVVKSFRDEHVQFGGAGITVVDIK